MTDEKLSLVISEVKYSSNGTTRLTTFHFNKALFQRRKQRTDIGRRSKRFRASRSRKLGREQKSGIKVPCWSRLTVKLIFRNPKDRILTWLKRTEEYPPWLTVDSWADSVAIEFRCLDLAPWLVGLIWAAVLSSGTSLLGLSSLFFLPGSFGKEVWGSDVLGFEDSAAVAGVGFDTCLFLPGSSSAEVKIRMLLGDVFIKKRRSNPNFSLRPNGNSNLLKTSHVIQRQLF